MPDPCKGQPDSWFDGVLREAGCSRRVIAHCHTVRDQSLRSCDSSGIADRDLVNAGSFLHDIGRGRTHTLMHAQAGGEYCRELGLPEEIARIVERHTGAGLTADECTILGLIPKSCMPETIEEKIVAASDNLVKGKEVVSIYSLLESARSLDRKVKRRLYRLWLETEAFRRA